MARKFKIGEQLTVSWDGRSDVVVVSVRPFSHPSATRGTDEVLVARLGDHECNHIYVGNLELEDMMARRDHIQEVEAYRKRNGCSTVAAIQAMERRS